jgi:hypothetical protein
MDKEARPVYYHFLGHLGTVRSRLVDDMYTNLTCKERQAMPLAKARICVVCGIIQYWKQRVGIFPQS